MSDWRVSFPKPCNESWEAMTPAGCDRFCGRCSRTIHDLQHTTFDEARDLMQRDPNACVRARIGADGSVMLKRGGGRRMVATIGASFGLLTAPAMVSAKDEKPRGVIAGKVAAVDWSTKVVATGPSGKGYRARVKGDGRFTIKHLPAGTYTLVFTPSCGEPWTVDKVVVSGDVAVTANTKDPNECIIVGMMRLDNADS